MRPTLGKLDFPHRTIQLDVIPKGRDGPVRLRVDPVDGNVQMRVRRVAVDRHDVLMRLHPQCRERVAPRRERLLRAWCSCSCQETTRW